MGKRRRDSDHSRSDRTLRCYTSSETMPYSAEMEHFTEEKALHPVDPGDVRPALDITDGSMKMVNAHPIIAHHHQSLGRSIYLKRSRHHYGHQYPQRHSAHHASASSSRGKGAFCDDKLSFRLASQSNSDSGGRSEYRQKAFYRPERIHCSSPMMESMSADVAKMICGICEKPLRRKLYFLGNSVSSNELSVVAVLVCGHAYHGDCLEQRTNPEDRWDPPCPSCSELLSQSNNSSAQ